MLATPSGAAICRRVLGAVMSSASSTRSFPEARPDPDQMSAPALDLEFAIEQFTAVKREFGL
jgi:hypothetical protein